MIDKGEKMILISNLPEDWKRRAADHYGKSASYVEKVAYGSIVNIKIFEFLVELAESNKLTQDNKMAELKERILNLAKPVNIVS